MPRQAAQTIAVIVVAAVLGVAFDGLGVPLAYLLAACACGLGLLTAGAEFKIPCVLVALAKASLGVMVGSRVTPDFGSHLISWWPSFLALAGLTVFSSLTSFFVLRRTSGLDTASCYYASLPSGIAEMSLAALSIGSDAAFVSAHHLFRILLVVVPAPWIASLPPLQQDQLPIGHSYGDHR